MATTYFEFGEPLCMHTCVVYNPPIFYQRFSVAQCGVEGGAVLEPHPSPPSDTPSMNEEDEELEAIRSQVRFSGAFNGVKFDNISWEITEKGVCRLWSPDL